MKRYTLIHGVYKLGDAWYVFDNERRRRLPGPFRSILKAIQKAQRMNAA